MAPNLILIVLDAARADAFEPYGAPPGSSPAIADLARRGQVVSKAYAAGSWTVPSHAALFTGLMPREVGFSELPGGTPYGCRGVLEPHRDRLLPEVLRANGYRTGAVSTNGWLIPRSGFDLGFDEFVPIDSGRQSGMGRSDLRSRLRWAMDGLRASADDGAAASGAVLDHWARRPPAEPFFWFVNLVEAHSPYLPPRPYSPLGPLGRLKAAAEARDYLTLEGVWKSSIGALEVPAEAIDRMRLLYAASIRLLDDWVAELLETLDGAGLLDETLFVVTADHGENLGEDGMLGHSFSLDERLLRVPLVASGPEIPADEPFSLVSLPWALAQALELGEHPWEPPATPGVAVAEFDPPTDSKHPGVAEMVRVWDLDEDTVPRFTTPLACATDGRLKLLKRGEEEILFDLEADPGEQQPFDPERGDGTAVARLRRALEAAPEPPPSRPATADPGDASPEELKALEERMRLLGYL